MIPGLAVSLCEMNSGMTLTYTLRKYLTNPAAITFVSSLNVLFNVLVGAVCLSLSDRIWTRCGRRTPFIIVSWLLVAVCLMLIPLVDNVVALIALIVVWLAAADVGTTYNTLQQEVIPPAQRGRAGAIGMLYGQGCWMLFTSVMIGRFDDRIQLGTVSVSGESTLYWSGALALLVGLVIIVVFVKERRPLNEPPHLPLSPTSFFRDIFGDKRLWPAYLLAFVRVFVTVGLGAVDVLLVTEQWGYTKQELGTNIAVGGIINLIIMLPIGWLADRFDRVKLYLAALVGALLLNALYYVAIQFFLPDRRPELLHMIIMGEALSICGLVAGILCSPLMYDYIPRDKLGVAGAGMGLVGNLTRMLLLNGAGLWVMGYSHLFCAPGTYDYLSGYLYIVFFNGLGCTLMYLFARRVWRGKAIAYGRLLADAPAPGTEIA